MAYLPLGSLRAAETEISPPVTLIEGDSSKVQVRKPMAAADTAGLLEEEDVAEPDSVPQSRADSVVLIKHRFNHKEQIITGGVIMSCIAAMMAIMNNYNPR